MCEKVILLAEDDPGHEELFRRSVAQSGIPCRMDVVHDGVEVIDYLFCTGEYEDRDHSRLPDLLLLDLKMPKMDGLQVLQVLHRVRGEERGRFPPVVVLTSSELDEDIADAYRYGAQSYICKPLGQGDFSKAVCDTLQYWLGLNQPMPVRRIGLHFVHEGL